MGYGSTVRGRRGIVAIVALFAILVGVLQPASAGGPRAGTFVALSYNVAGLPDAISGSEPATNSPLISPLLNAYDLVLLQEDWADTVEAAPLFFYHHEIVAEADHPHRSEPAPHPYGTDLRRFPSGPILISDGLNRLSRFPFGELERQMWAECYGEFAVEAVETIVGEAGLSDLVDEAGLGEVVDGGASDCSAQKGFSVARTELADGVEVDIYNLHAEAGSGPADREARAAGFGQLADFIDDHSRDRAIILGGDTNLHSTDPDRPDGDVWDEFQIATGVLDVCSVVDCGDDDGEIDKFAFRSGDGVELRPLSHRFERERFERDDGEPLSDHDPLAVRFHWRASNPSP